MVWTAPVLPSCFAELFALILRGVREAIAAGGLKAGADLLPLIIPASGRVSRLSARFVALVAAVRAGRFAARRPSSGSDQIPARKSRPQPVAEDAQAAMSGLPVPPKPVRLPRGFGWMLRFGSAVACHRSQLEHWLLTNPELGQVLEAAPREAGRILRPLCHMLGIVPPPALRLPPRPPRVRPKPAAAPRPKRPTKAEIRSWLPGQKRPLPWSRRPAVADPPPRWLKPPGSLKPA